MKAILLLAAIHIMIIYQSQKSKATVKTPMSQPGDIAGEGGLVTPSAIIFSEGIKAIKNDKPGFVSVLFTKALPFNHN